MKKLVNGTTGTKVNRHRNSRPGSEGPESDMDTEETISDTPDDPPPPPRRGRSARQIGEAPSTPIRPGLGRKFGRGKRPRNVDPDSEDEDSALQNDEVSSAAEAAPSTALEEYEIQATEAQKELATKLTTAQNRHMNLLKDAKLDTLLKELYAAMLKYFEVHDLTNYKIFHPKIDDRKFQKAMEIQFDSKLWKKRMQIQKLLGYFWTSYKSSQKRTKMLDPTGRGQVYSIIAKLLLEVEMAKHEKREWTTLRLESTQDEPTQVQHDFEKIYRDLVVNLQNIEEQSFVDGETNTYYFVHHSTKPDLDLGFFSIRVQRISVSNTKSTANDSTTVTFCLKRSLPYLFLPEKIADDLPSDLMQEILNALGFTRYAKQNLVEKGLSKLINCFATSTRVKRTAAVLELEYAEEEKELNARGIYCGNREAELRIRRDVEELLKSATGVGNVQNCHIICNEPGFKFQTIMKCKKGTIADEIVKLYENGIIFDLEVFMNLVKSHSNIWYSDK